MWYNAHGKMVIVLSAAFAFFVASTTVHAEVFEKKGLYRVKYDGWLQKIHPDGNVFICKLCKHNIQILITFGPTFRNAMSDREFIGKIRSQGGVRKFSKIIIEKQIPMKKDVTISIQNAKIMKFQGKNVLQFSAIVKFRTLILRDTTIVTAHKNRIMKITVNYVDGALNDNVRKHLSAFLNSIVFM